MKRNLCFTLIILSGVSLAGLLTGCYPLAPKENMIKRTTEYNLVAERTGNEMLLLNIVRASQRRPMYFTSFGKLTGNITYEFGTGGIKIPFGAIGSGENGSYSIAPSATYRSSPLFDMAVLDTKEFTCGIMKPVSMTTIEYYWRQGWPQEMLLYLFINRLEIREPNGVLRYGYDNDPDGPTFGGFQKQIQTEKWTWDIEEDPNAACIGKVDVNAAAQLKDLIEVQKAGLRLRQSKGEKDKMELLPGQAQYIFTRVEKTEGRKKVAENAKTAKPEADRTKAEAAKTEAEKAKAGKTEAEETQEENLSFGLPGSASPITKDKRPYGVVYLRSPEAVLYYLGEILRAEMKAADKKECPNVPIVHSDPRRPEARPAVLFCACKSKAKGKGKAVAPWLSVDYEGTTYVIPGCPDTDEGNCTDRSMHVLSLVSQLIGMQKTSAELPATGVVNVIGR